MVTQGMVLKSGGPIFIDNNNLKWGIRN
jgi:hypothetical protein